MLSNMDISSMVQQAKEITKISDIEVRYKYNVEENNNSEDSYGYGHDDKKTDWTDWETYECSIDTVDEYNINDYDFGNVQEGDLVVLFPPDTNLEKNAMEYELRLGDDDYNAKTGLKEQGFVGGKFLYYVMVGGLK